MELCMGCGKPINPGEPSYYRKNPADDIGESFHSTCGDPLGIKAKDAEIERLRDDVANRIVVTKGYSDELERLRGLLQAIKNICAGERVPRWQDDWNTTHSRGVILDICDSGLGNTRNQ